jgi:drug/metabolite transporter (DMT)-like permease
MVLMATFAALWAVVEAIAGGLLVKYSPYQVVWTRYAVHLTLMLALWGWRTPSSLWRTSRPGFQLGRSLLMLVMPASWVVGMQLGMHSGTLMAVFWLAPLMILGLAMPLLSERVPMLVWVLAALATLGGSILFLPAPWPRAWVLVAPLAMGLSFATYVVMTRSLRAENVRANLFYTAAGVFLALTPFMPIVWITPNLHDFAVLVAIGLLGYLALFALDRAAAAAPLAASTPFCFLQLLFTVAIAQGLGHFHVDLRSGFGLALITVVAIVAWARTSQRITQVAP